MLDYVLQNYRLTQKGYIAFGIIARERKILSTQLSAILQLSEEERLRSYTDKLVKDNIVCRKGIKKGSFFSINPQLIKNGLWPVQRWLRPRPALPLRLPARGPLVEPAAILLLVILRVGSFGSRFLFGCCLLGLSSGAVSGCSAS